MNNCKSHHHMDAGSEDDADGQEAWNEHPTEPLSPQSPSIELGQEGKLGFLHLHDFVFVCVCTHKWFGNNLTIQALDQGLIITVRLR